MPVMEIPKNIDNPFGDSFLPTWDLWKQYMWLSHQFKYRSIISEQMAINHLVDLSDGYEDKAIKIVNQSIRLEYKGFFPLRQTTTSNGSKSTKRQSGSTKNEAASGSTLRERVQAEFNKRNGGGEQAGGESHLKAV